MPFDPRSDIPEFAALIYGFQKLLPIVQGLFRGVSSLRSGSEINNEVRELANIKQDESISADSSEREMQELRTLSWADLKYQIPRDGKELINFPNGLIKTREKVVILGPSGAGKSTFLNILMGFINPSGGNVSINGSPVTPNDIKMLRLKSGLVGQETFIRGATIREAIELKIGNYDHRIAEIEHMASIMRLTESAGFENWLDTELVSGGANLSVGQRQRISIILELIGGKEVLFLDEFTSALDSDNAKAVMTNLQIR